VRGLRALVRARAPGLELRVTVTRQNAPHLAPFARTARDLGVLQIVFKRFRHSTAGRGQASLHPYHPRHRIAAIPGGSRPQQPVHPFRPRSRASPATEKSTHGLSRVFFA
jgi:phosphoribulokinase